MAETLQSCCAEHGVVLGAEYTKLFDGTLLTKLMALVKAYGPELAKEIPTIMADITAGNYLGALILIVETLATFTPPTPAA